MVSLTAPVPRPGGGPAKALHVQRKAATGPSSSSSKPATTTTTAAAAARKRTGSQAGMDIDVPGPPDSPTKKSRVRFDPSLDVGNKSEEGAQHADKPTDLIREEVSRALNRQRNFGTSAEYTAIRKAFEQEQGSDNSSGLPSRRKLLQAMTRIPSSLDYFAKDLVAAILGSDWVTKDAEYVDTFSRFLVCLISARPAWISAAMEMLVGKFARPLPSSHRSSDISRKEAQERVHHVVAQIIDVSPLDGAISLRKTLQNLFPSDEDSTKAHILYTHNLLKVIEYAPQLETDILAVITERITKIDVQVQTDIEDLDDLDDILNEGASEDIDTFMDSLDDEDEEEEDEIEDEPDMTDTGTSEQLAQAIKNKIQKMDVLLDMLFEYYYYALDGSDDIREAAYNVLQSHFDGIVLHAYRSRHVQFLIFHFAQTSLEFIDSFVGFCLQRAMDKTRPALVRHSAAAYLGSFVARGAHVPTRVVRDVFTFIGDELSDMRAEFEPKCIGPDLRRFGTYYSLVQALLYIFCFRWKDLETTPSEPGSSPEPYNSATVVHEETHHVFIPKVREILSRNVFSKLNPLKICAPVIAEVFAKVARQVGILYAFSLLETNKRLRLYQTNLSALGRETSLSAAREDEHFQLDGYFPFDPYHLPRSKRWLQDDYREWEEQPDDGNEEDEGEDSDDDEDTGDEDDE